MHDREIMALNCDAFDERRQLETGQWDLTFFVFNPTTEDRDANLIFPIAAERKTTLIDDGRCEPLAGGRWQTRLSAGESRRINVIIETQS